MYDESRAIQDRDALGSLLERARSEPELTARRREDPDSVLAALDLDETMTADVKAEIGGVFSSSGGPLGVLEWDCDDTCDLITCIVTACGCIPWTS